MSLETISEIKSFVVEKVLERMNHDEEQTDLQMRTTRQLAIDSPGRMQSRYDSTKQELSYLVDSYQNRLSDIKKEKSVLENFKIVPAGEEIKTGDMVELDTGSTRQFYLILPYGGGVVTEVPNFGGVTVITPLSPLGKILLGKIVGDSVVCNGKEFKIMQIL